MNITGKKILVGVTGSIAAYKTILLVRLLVKTGAEVKVIMTPSASSFASPLVFETLSKNPVLHEIADGSQWSNHVMLGRWADIFLIAPASCNSISKMAAGICDNLLMAVYLSATSKILLAPAMDEDMWHHPTTKRNIETLRSFGNIVLPTNNGELASGLFGEGRMAEPEEIISFLENFFTTKSKKLIGMKALITAGPTYEAIDPVRFIGNHSSGKMGIEIAKAMAEAGAETTLILGPSSILVPTVINTIRVTSALEMYNIAINLFPNSDLAVMAAAVADYRPASISEEKIKKGNDENLNIELVKNPDILKSCGAMKKAGQVLMGFALETNNEKDNAIKKLYEKNADFIVLNSLRDLQSGFGTDTNKVTVFGKDGFETSLSLQQKSQVAQQLVEILTAKLLTQE